MGSIKIQCAQFFSEKYEGIYSKDENSLKLTVISNYPPISIKTDKHFFWFIINLLLDCYGILTYYSSQIYLHLGRCSPIKYQLQVCLQSSQRQKVQYASLKLSFYSSYLVIDLQVCFGSFLHNPVLLQSIDNYLSILFKN